MNYSKIQEELVPTRIKNFFAQIVSIFHFQILPRSKKQNGENKNNTSSIFEASCVFCLLYTTLRRLAITDISVIDDYATLVLLLDYFFAISHKQLSEISSHLRFIPGKINLNTIKYVTNV